MVFWKKWFEVDDWFFVDDLKDEKIIDEFEEEIGGKFPQEFRDFAIKYNGGHFKKTVCFSAENGSERVFDRVFSFNRNHPNSFWKLCSFADEYYDEYKEQTGDDLGYYLPFADEPSGDLICFDVRTHDVVLFEQERCLISKIAPSFNEFLNSLYEESRTAEKARIEASNNQLKRNVTSNPVAKKNFSAANMKLITAGKRPDGFVWHFDATPGSLKLVDSWQHQFTGHSGGRVLWCDK